MPTGTTYNLPGYATLHYFAVARQLPGFPLSMWERELQK